METSYNARCPAVRRLLREALELHEATEEYFAQPLEDNLFEWHFTVRGPPDTDFDGGIYHGRIIMPAEYPMKPPNIIFLTPNGRFETNKKICLSISGHHPETWQPSWSIRIALLAIIGFMPTPSIGTIGSLDFSSPERAVLAKKSLDFKCQECGNICSLLKERTGNNEDIQKEAREVSSQMIVIGKKEDSSDSKNSDVTLEATQQSTESIGEAEQVPSPTIELLSELSTSSPNREEPVQSSQISMGRSVEHSTGMSLTFNNILLTAASVLLIALIVRRIFLLESDIIEDVDDIVL